MPLAAETPGAVPTGLDRTGIALATALFGALVLAWLAFVVVPGSGPVHFGTRIYDEAWLALRVGEVELPARLLRYEGHYAPDGTGYLYHGAGPLLLRALLSPFVDLTQVSLAPLSIWVWTVAGTAFFHAALHTAAGPGSRRRALLLGLAAWFCGPALLLVANHALYHEPIAMAYGLAGAAIWLWHRHFVLSRGGAWSCLLGLGLLAALCLQARPNLAVALYVATGLAALLLLWRLRARALVPAILSLALLAGGVAGYIGYNALRFGDGTVTHGSFEPSALQYGSIYWGHETLEGNRARTFIDHGRFDPARILPNTLQYVLGPPQKIAPALSRAEQELFYALTLERLGYIRIEGPDAGMLFLWPMWLLLALRGLSRAGRPGLPPLAPLGLAFALSGLLTLSYATITLRYHVDLWPLLAVPVLAGVARLSQPGGGRGLVLGAVLGGCVIFVTGGEYADNFRTVPSGFAAAWDRAKCEELVRRKGIPGTEGAAGAERLDWLCRTPRTEGRAGEGSAAAPSSGAERG